MQSGHYCCFCNTRNCIVPYREKRKNGNVPSLRDWLLINMKQNTSSWKRIKSWGFYVQRPAGSLGWRDRKKDVLPKGSEGWLESVTQRFPACFGLTMGLRAEIRMGEDLPVHLVSVHPNTRGSLCHSKSLAYNYLYIRLYFFFNKICALLSELLALPVSGRVAHTCPSSLTTSASCCLLSMAKSSVFPSAELRALQGQCHNKQQVKVGMLRNKV